MSDFIRIESNIFMWYTSILRFNIRFIITYSIIYFAISHLNKTIYFSINLNISFGLTLYVDRHALHLEREINARF